MNRALGDLQKRTELLTLHFRKANENHGHLNENPTLMHRLVTFLEPIQFQSGLVNNWSRIF